jgi:hypothetical protein
VRLMRVGLAATALLLLATGRIHAAPVTTDGLREVGENLPVMAPDLIWEQQLPGRRSGEPRQPNVPVDKELVGAIQALSCWLVSERIQDRLDRNPGTRHSLVFARTGSKSDLLVI